MPDINVKGRYRIYTHDGIEPLPFTSYSNSLCSIRRPNPNTFITISTYIPGSLSPFTTFDPGSSYTIVTKSNTADFSMGPYTRADRLPSSVTFRSPNFYHGLDKNSITVALSSYALSVNAPLSTAFTYIPNQNGYFINSISFNTERLKEGLPSLLTHLTPGSSYQFINRTPFTFFAPLQSEMGDAFAWGNNNGGEFGMGYRYNNRSLPGDNIYGVWDKIVSINSTQGYLVNWNGQTFVVGSFAALSACGNSNALFVLGNNYSGQLGTGSSQQYYPTWTRVAGQWKDVAMGAQHMLATNDSGHLYACGSNQYGQLGLGYYGGSHNTLTLVDSGRNYVQLAAKEENTMVLDSFGFLHGCGRNRYGELGKGNTTAVNVLIRETTYSIWSSVKAITRSSRGGFVAISDKKLYGTSSNDYRYLYGALPDATFTAKFKQEQLGLTDVESVVYSQNDRGTYIKRENQDMLFASRYPYYTYFRLSAGDDTYFSKTIIPSNVSSLNYNFYILNNRLYYCANAVTSPVFIDTNVNAFNMFEQYTGASTGNNGGTTLFLLSSANHFRPTPTPTPTPSPNPFLPPTILQVGIFGSSFGSSNNSQQNFAYNSPGNLSNNFILDSPNAGYIPPGRIQSSTFDYEKGNFNNIVGIGVNVLQSPNKRYIYKKIGSNWTYTLLPSDMDASTTYETYSFDHGCDTLLITPEHPDRSTSQGVYNLIFVRNRYFNEAVSYDRGLTWTIKGQVFTGPNYYSITYADTNKVLYSRSRGVNYKVCAVMVSSNRSQIFFAQRFPDFNSSQLIYTSSNIFGFNFTHDYNDIPTVVSGKVDSDAIGTLALTRRINGSWQTVVVKQNIANFAISPGISLSLSDMWRINSPTVGLEVDPTNYNLIYIAYLTNGGFGSYDLATYINVLCYNMATNSIVFDESVVRATRAQGTIYPSIHTVDSLFADVPSLFYDKTNNSLNLFFVGWSSVATPGILNFRMTRINGNWSAPTRFTPGTSNVRLSNNNELRVKY